MTEQRPPKVFISYSHDTVEHQERVLSLADRLRADGIDAEVDQYNTAPREGWPLWCERQIAAADVVLMVCTETYHRRVSGDEERGKGLGVVWEARIIRQLLYDSSAVSDKFVPVLFSDASPEHIPATIKGWTRYVVDTEDGYEHLYRRLTGQPRLLRPALGTIRPMPTRERQWPEGTKGAASSSRAPALAPALDNAASARRGTPVRTLWRFLRQNKNRQVLGWLGIVVVVLAGGVWALVTFFSSPDFSIPPEEVAGISKALNSEQKLTNEQRRMITELSGKIGVSEGALKTFFRTLEKPAAPLEQQEAKLVEFAENYKQALAKAATAPGDDPEVAELKGKAKAALEAGELQQAEDLLARVQEVHKTAPSTFSPTAGVSAPDQQILLLNIARLSADRTTNFNISGQEFTERILSPINEDAFAVFLSQGVRIDLLARLMGDAFQTLTRDRRGERFYYNRVYSPDDYRTFRAIALHLGWLQQSGQLFVNELTFDQVVLDRVPQQPSTGDIVSAQGGGLAWKQTADGTFTLSRAVKGRVMISNYDPRTLGDADRERLNESASRNPDNFVLVDVRPEYPGGNFPIFGALKLRSLFAMLDFAGKSIRLFPEFAVDPDPRTGIEICDHAEGRSSPEPRICVRNPVRTLDIEVSDVAPRKSEFSVEFKGQYYTIADTRWDRAAFMLLYQVFELIKK